MKIYISAPVKNRPELGSFFGALKTLSSKGHKIIDIYNEEDLVSSDDVVAIAAKYKQMEKAIRESEVVLVEASFPGRRIGFEIARALDEKRMVIALYHGDLTEKAPGLLLGTRSKHFMYKKYTDSDVLKMIEEGLDEAKKNLDTKFILIISPEIDRYLEWSASERRMHKAQIVRNSIDEAIEKDKEYKQFLRELESN